ncbi:hypothetical protein JYT48_02200 [Mariprofundus ferrooxydans]|nr:hypothetical protein [Mariprofundus ferrooxydans]
MHAIISPRFKFIGSIVLLVVLSSCGSLQSLLLSTSDDGASALKEELRDVDQANDRAASRNKMMWEMIAASDHICEQYINDMLSDSDASFPLRERSVDALDTKLTAAIGLRSFDQTNAESTLFAALHVGSAAAAIRTALAKTITRTRGLARIQLKARLGGYISEYSVKQALMDVAAYHNSCSARFAATELARVTTMQMSDTKREASIETLMQLRQKLMSEGMNTRAVQQKIDALILDY